jgi:hypothetical protein
MPIDALFERGELKERVKIEHLRLRHVAFDRNGPRRRAKVSRLSNWIVFPRSELVEVVVTGNVLVQSCFLSRAEGTLYGDELRSRKSQPACETKRGRCAGEESAPAEIDVLRCDR